MNGEIRLNHGDEGLLEFYYNEWGYVCDDGWNIVASNIACRSLGFKGASSFQVGIVNSSLTAVFNLNDVQCVGDETSLLECSYSNDHDCDNSEHVYLTCASGRLSLIYLISLCSWINSISTEFKLTSRNDYELNILNHLSIVELTRSRLKQKSFI